LERGGAAAAAAVSLDVAKIVRVKSIGRRKRVQAKAGQGRRRVVPTRLGGKIEMRV
jgi:hypothetical protein